MVRFGATLCLTKNMTRHPGGIMGQNFSGPELCSKSAVEVRDLLLRKEVSTEDLIAASMERIAQTGPAVNATVTTCRDRAEAAEIRGDAQQRGWLGGMPVGIKDLQGVAGVRTTFGNETLSDFVPTESDPIVERIEERGGVVIGKTNTPEMGAGANTFNAVFGMTRNPWDTRKNAGGSSGGAAASLAVGEAWLSQGSDLAGSLRTPAAYCGVVGLRPSPGLVPGGAGANGFGTEGVMGPMARSVTDCALFLDTMAGQMDRDPLTFHAPAESYLDAVGRADGKVRIAYSRDLNGFSVTSDAMDAVLRAALAKVEAGGAVVDEGCPDLPDMDKTYRTLRAMLWAAGPARLPEAVTSKFKRTLSENIEVGLNLTASEIYDAQIGRTKLYRNTVSFLQDFDVLAFPVVGLFAGPVEEEYPTEIDGKPLGDYLEWLKYSFLSPTTTLPSISVPVGFNDDGMPVGIQLLAGPRGEARLLQVARAFEVACGGPLGPIDPVVRH